MIIFPITDQDARSTGATKSSGLRTGQLAQTSDGRKYRYARAGAVALVVAELQVAATVEGNHQNRTANVARAIGDKQISATLGATAAAADLYADGYVTTRDLAGEGITYLINNHATVASSGVLTANLDEGITVAITTASEVSFSKNPWDAVVVSVTDQADMPVGISNVAVAISGYCWLQTGGPCAIKADETITAGLALTTGTSVGGEVEALDAAGEVQIGVAIEAGVDNEHTLAYLTID